MAGVSPQRAHLLALLVAVHCFSASAAAPLPPPPTLPPYITAIEWAGLFNTKWSKGLAEGLEFPEARLGKVVLDKAVSAMSAAAERALRPDQKGLFLVRYLDSREADAVKYAKDLAGAVEIQPVSAPYAGFRYFIVYITTTGVNQLRQRLDVIKAVSAFPAAVKVEPIALGAVTKLLPGIKEQARKEGAVDLMAFVPKPPLTIEVVLWKEAAPDATAAEALARRFGESLRDRRAVGGAIDSLLSASKKVKQAVDQAVEQATGKGSAAEAVPDMTAITTEAHNDAHLLVKELDLKTVGPAVLWLAMQPEVWALQEAPRFKNRNFWARTITQGGNVLKTPLYDSGLTGLGEVVGVADSGVDYKHCFFNDEGMDTPPINKVDPKRRVIISYIVAPGADAVDDEEGHGSHVSGTVLGRTVDSSIATTVQAASKGLPSSFGGVAQGAKLAFYDYQKSGAPGLVIPDKLADMFDPMYKAGARIMSNSWGAFYDEDKVQSAVQNKQPVPPYPYDESSAQVDAYLRAHDDTLFVFAAGNEGHFGVELNTLDSPGNGKNVLAIGCALNDKGAFDLCGKCSCTDCESLPNPPPDSEDPSVISFFSSKGGAATAAAGRIKPDVTAPGMWLWSTQSAPNAKGPVCGLRAFSGTSMATPATSGTLALVRQYFRDGYYPTGAPVKANGFVPSGALLKATAIHSAVPMAKYMTPDGDVAKDIPPGGPPDRYQGFGRIQMDTVLKLEKGTANSPPALFVKSGQTDGATFEKQGVQHNYKFDMTAPGSFKVTLVYMDLPAAPGARQVLINDLNLFVIGPGGAKVYPNQLKGPDAYNNVEVVNIPRAVPGGYTVTVAATHIMPPDPQPYALVVTGAFDVAKVTSEAVPLDAAVGAEAAGALKSASTSQEGSAPKELDRELAASAKRMSSVRWAPTASEVEEYGEDSDGDEISDYDYEEDMSEGRARDGWWYWVVAKRAGLGKEFWSVGRALGRTTLDQLIMMVTPRTKSSGATF